MGISSSDTIFGVATGAGKAGIAVLRISGSEAGPILKCLCGDLPRPRRASLRHLRAPDGETVDHGVVLWFPAPASYTGENVAELHVHGGAATLDALATVLATLGARPAEAGEFTRRAFLSGRIDLVEAEGIGDLIDAETSDQRRQALAHAGGAMSRIYGGWAAELRQVVALQEATIDFPDETASDGIGAIIVARANALLGAFDAHLATGNAGEILRNGVTICVSGPPNVGKSSLVNRLSGRDGSIVSPHPGTTRDVIETRLVVRGVPVILVDTAGLREAVDEIEVEGIARAERAAESADLVLTVGEPGAPPIIEAGGRTLAIVNKVDMGAAPPGMIGVSARTGEGIGSLRDKLAEQVGRLAGIGGQPAMARTRHRLCITEARDHLRQACDAEAEELRGEGLRLAHRSLCRLTGHVDVEGILDTIFASFCIGK